MHCIIFVLLLYSVHCILCIEVVLYALQAMYFIICIVSFALYYMHCIISIVLHKLYYMHYFHGFYYICFYAKNTNYTYVDAYNLF